MLQRPYVVRFIAVLLFATLPGFGLALWTGLEQRQAAAAAARQRALELARLVVERDGRFERLPDLVSRADFPPGTTAVVIDAPGRIMATLGEGIPEVGASVGHVPIVRQALAEGTGTMDAPGLDGRHRLHAFLPLGAGGRGAVIVGIPSEIALGEVDRALRRNLAALGLVVILSLALGWFGIGASVLRKLRAVSQAAGRIAAGDFSVRLSDQARAGELGVLARTFDDMAMTLGRRTNRLQTLIEVNRAVSASLDVDKVLTTIARSVSDLMGAPAVRFWLVDEESRTVSLRAFAGPEDIHEEYPRPLPFGEGGVGWVALHGRVLDVPDIFGSDSPILYRDWHRKYGFTACHLVPVFFGGMLVAVLSLIGREPIRLDPDSRDLLDALMSQAAAAIHNARLHRLTDVRRQAAEALADLSHLIARAPDLAEVASRIAESLRLVLDARQAAFFGLDPLSQDLTVLGSVVPDGGFPLGQRLPRGTATAGLAVERRETIVTTDVLSDPRVTIAPETRAILEASPFRAVAALPCLLGSRAIGVLVAAADRGHVFEPERLRLGQALADQATVVLENARLLRDMVSSGERYRNLVERNQVGIYRIRPDGVLLECNDAFALLLGAASREQVIGRDLHTFYADPDDRLALVEDLSNGRVVRARPLRLCRLDGAPISVLNSVAMVEDESGRTIFEGNLLDVTDRERAAEAERRAEALRSVTQLAAGAAHEINNPLMVILGHLSLFARSSSPDPEFREAVDQTIAAGWRIAEIVKSMSRISRLEMVPGSPDLPPLLDISRSGPPRSEPSSGPCD